MFTSTIHSESSALCLPTSTSLHSTLEHFILGSFLSQSCFLHIESTQSWIAASNLPQPRVDLIQIAATPAINRR